MSFHVCFFKSRPYLAQYGYIPARSVDTISIYGYIMSESRLLTGTRKSLVKPNSYITRYEPLVTMVRRCAKPQTLSNKSTAFIGTTLSGRWDESRVVSAVVGAGHNKQLTCNVCGLQGGPAFFLRTHDQALCDLPEVEPELALVLLRESPAKQVTETHPVVQSVISCRRTLELLEMLLSEENVGHMTLRQMFGAGARHQGDAVIWDKEGQTETPMLKELIALVEADLKMTLIYSTVIVTDGDGDETKARSGDQEIHKDCTPLMYGVLGPVHSVFLNFAGTRTIGTVGQDIVLSSAQRTVLHGRYSHFGKGRTSAEGNSCVFHAFGVVKPLPVMFTGLPQERQDYIMKLRPELDSENPSMATAWPRDNVFMVCKHCSRRFMHFQCQQCDDMLCYACAPMEQTKCGKCEKKKAKKTKYN